MYGKNNFILIILIILFTFELYFNSLNNDFVYDDNLIIKENEELRFFLKNIPNFFNKNYFKIASKNNTEASYRPIPTFSYYINYQIWKLNPLGYRVFNLTFHILNAILLFFLMKKIINEEINSFLITMFFASHPALTEVLNCITYNEDIFSLFFILISFLLYLKQRDSINSFSTIFIYIFFFFSLLSKEMSIVFPILLLLYEFVSNKKNEKNLWFNDFINTLWKKKKFYFWFLILIILFFYINFILLKNPEKITPRDYGSLIERIIYAPNNIITFIKITIFPFNLNADYSFSYPKSFFSLKNIISYAILILIIIISFLSLKKLKLIFFGIWWFLITILPVLNIIKLYNPIAERYLYIPMIGFCIILTMLLELTVNFFQKLEFMKKFQINFYYFKIVLALIIFFFYGILTVNRNKVWKNDFTLSTDILKKNPDNPRALLNHSIGLVERKRFDEALNELLKVIKLAPKEYKAYFMLGNVYYFKNEHDNAIKAYLNTIKLKPEFLDSYKNLAVVYAEKGEYQTALKYIDYVLEKNPSDIESLRNKKIILDMTKMNR